ncbi:uncharacterized protein MELLADRAFT_112129 [Melampsora larici-populina 98AG31]|uniref:Uncharacterized protein n=1 Tax=Melampsora larici-populina (strain 98AG31 / pathotype 3-4-7) TaxID=747676 RepID=F4S5H3_MELLP|nr:uncharacterized protein MELLADRAFT_112129 [Melampsora larici-populina 98AG31]EGG00107.1 hypothetical protein MELLADRAFT_112129 [Melampsora larici-populina 98AG31]
MTWKVDGTLQNDNVPGNILVIPYLVPQGIQRTIIGAAICVSSQSANICGYGEAKRKALPVQAQSKRWWLNEVAGRISGWCMVGWVLYGATEQECGKAMRVTLTVLDGGDGVHTTCPRNGTSAEDPGVDP